MPIAPSDVSNGLGTIYIEKGRLEYLSFGAKHRAAFNDLEHKKVGGFSSPVPMITDWGGDVSADESVAFANDDAAPQIGEFDPTQYLVPSHRAVALGSELLGRLEGNPENLLTTAQAKTDMSLESVLDETERQLWDEGYGVLAQITNTGFATTTATVTPASAAKFFRKDQHIVFGATKTGALRDSGASNKVVSRDPINGTVEFANNLNTVTGTDTNDYMFQKGTAMNGGTLRKAIYGFSAWASTPSAGENFMGQDRTDDPAHLAMLQGTGSVTAIQRAVESNAALGYDINGAMINRGYLNPQDLSLLSQQMGVDIRRSPGTKTSAGFSFMEINSVTGGDPVILKGSPYIQRNKLFLFDWPTWKLAHLWGRCVDFDRTDGQLARKLDGASGIQIRVFSFRQLYSTAPGKNVMVTLS